MDTPHIRQARRIADLCAVDRQVRDARPLDAVGAAVRRPDMRLAQIIATIMAGYADRPALGQRAIEATIDSVTGRRTVRLLPRFETLSYRQLWARVGAVAAEWHSNPKHRLRAGDFVAILGVTGVDYTTLDLACVHLGAVSVPLQADAPDDQLRPILTETAPRILATSAALLDRAVECARSGHSPSRLLVFDYDPGEEHHCDALESARRRLPHVLVDTLDAVVECGRAAPPAPLFAADADDTMTLLIYTSGSTGTPKGAIYTEKLVTRMWRNSSTTPAITIGYLPMSHVAARLSLFGTLARGGTVYFTGSRDISTLFDDVALVRPTEMAFAPRVCETLLQRYRTEVDTRCAEGLERAVAERHTRLRMRQDVFGGRVVYAIFGSAPLASEIKAFMAALLGFELHDGYGCTEAVDILLDHRVQRPPVIDYKLVDAAELGYFTTDKPHPRGELLVRTESMIPGYYQQPEATAAIFDPEGYYRTGDIMAEIEPGHLIYVDRRNNVLKLSQGEFVTVARLEAIYGTSPLIRHIFLYGNSERSYLLAVIVPTEEAWNGVVATTSSAIAESLRRIAEDAGLNPYEIPRDFVIESEPFTTGNGLLSGIGKVLRPQAKARYGERLEQLYRDHAQDQVDELRALRRIAAGLPVFEAVGRAARAMLGCSRSDLRPEAHFTELGGDSLAALAFSNLLQELLGVEVPVGVIIGPAADLGHLAEYVEHERRSRSLPPTFAAVHGAEGIEIRADHLTLDKFIDTATLARAAAMPHADDVPHAVLLTGATGYLGRFLCLEWLQRLERTGGTLICLVRGSDVAAARRRLDVAFDRGDVQLLQHFRDLADRHLEVLTGDIGEPALGLDAATWNRLAARVDLIVHPAALVNHVLSYRNLFNPNVIGTAELIRLAITTRIKAVDYLSTVGVAAQVASSIFNEDDDIRTMSPVRSLDESYANGYSNSKWAGEVLLREAHDLCRLPARVFRSDLILAHSRYAGQLNAADMFTRLLLSLVVTGLAPHSFYRTDSHGGRQRAHYDGLPVDFVAAAITALGACAEPDFRTFHVVNPHDDGIALDEFVDWLIEAGHGIERISDYHEWLERFETALRALPQKQRSHSLLPLLHGYRYPAEPIAGSAIPAKSFQVAVHAAADAPNTTIPHLTPRLIHKYTADLRSLDLL
ncbi:MAG: carboxylic acid reductase [Pseudonocardiaceae bacterium]